MYCMMCLYSAPTCPLLPVQEAPKILFFFFFFKVPGGPWCQYVCHLIKRGFSWSRSCIFVLFSSPFRSWERRVNNSAVSKQRVCEIPKRSAHHPLASLISCSVHPSSSHLSAQKSVSLQPRCHKHSSCWMGGVISSYSLWTLLHTFPLSLSHIHTKASTAYSKMNSWRSRAWIAPGSRTPDDVTGLIGSS